TIWYNPTTDILNVWDGSEWVESNFINYDVDTTTGLQVDDFYYNTTSNLWFNWNGIEWVEVDPIESLTDPYSLPIGTFWYNPTNMTLQQSISTGPTVWSPIVYTTTPPFPVLGFTFI